MASLQGSTPLTTLLTPIQGLKTQGFNPQEGHYGLDFAAPEGTPFSSVAEGVVAHRAWTPEFGYTNTLTATVLADIAKNWRYSVLAGGLGLAADGLYNLGSTAEPDFVDGTYYDYSKTRYGASFNYVRDQKLYVDFNAVYEGNSV